MPAYYFFAQIQTDVKSTDLAYELKAINTVNSKKKLIFTKSALLIHSLNSSLKTDFFVINTTVEEAKDYIILISLYRKKDGKLIKVLSDYIVSNLITDFSIKGKCSTKIDIVKYSETLKDTLIHNNSKNVEVLKLNNKRIFRASGHTINSESDPFTKTKIEHALKSRLMEPYPDQDKTNLCGPAAFFYCVLHSNKSIYAKVVKELWEKGKTSINQLKIDAGEASVVRNFYRDNGKPAIPAIDWITLGSLRASENSVILYNDTKQALAAITDFPIFGDWLKKSGFNIVEEYKRLVGVRHTQSIIRINNSYPVSKYFIILLTKGSILRGQPDSPSPFPSHWVVLGSNLRGRVTGWQSNTVGDPREIVDFKVFSWGKIYDGKSMNLSELCSEIFGIYVVSKKL